jgi:hypothetical protein
MKEFRVGATYVARGVVGREPVELAVIARNRKWVRTDDGRVLRVSVFNGAEFVQLNLPAPVVVRAH